MNLSPIEWTDLSLNFQSSCSEAGPECDNCYTRLMSARLRRFGQARYQDAVDDSGAWTGRITFDEAALHRAFDALERRKKSAMVFPGSMTDLWHKDAPKAGQALFAARIQRLADLGTPLVLQCLTKR